MSTPTSRNPTSRSHAAGFAGLLNIIALSLVVAGCAHVAAANETSPRSDDAETAIVVTPHLRPALSERRVTAAWTSSVAANGPVVVKSSPGGEVIAVIGSQTITLLAARTGRIRARIAASDRVRTVVTDDAIVILRQRSIIGYDFDGRAHPWPRASGITDIMGGSRVVFALRIDQHNYQKSGTLSARTSHGAIRWSQSVPGNTVLHGLLPEDIAVVQWEVGAPMFTYNVGFDADKGRQLWSCYNVQVDENGMSEIGLMNGSVQCRAHSDGPAEAIDGYQPAFIQGYSLFGGRDDGIRAYRPNARMLATQEDGQAADTVFYDDSADYVGIAGRLFRYERVHGTPLHPLLLMGISSIGATDGRRAVLQRAGIPYAISMVNGIPELTPLAPQGATLTSQLLFAPYLVERTGFGWFAVDVDRPRTLLRLDEPCVSAQVVAAYRSFVFACPSRGGVTLASLPVEVQPSYDALLRSSTVRTAAAEATPTPEPERVAMTPLILDIDTKRTPDDLRPRLISPAARSIRITIDGRTKSTIVPLRASQHGCNAAAEGVSCSTTFPLPYGHHHLTMAIVDGDDGNGNTLALASTAYVNDGAPRGIEISLHGVLGGIRLRAHDPATKIIAGHAQDIMLDINAIDRDGFPILNQAAYLHPIVVRLSDAVGKTTLSSATIPAARTPLTLHYDGSPGSAVVIVASSEGIDDVRFVLPISP